MKFPSYTRTNPTRQFFELIEMYKTMHTDGYVAAGPDGSRVIAGQSVYPGDALPMWAAFIRQEILSHGSKSLLDYGAGKARYYTQPQNFLEAPGQYRTAMLKPYWNDVEITTYEPGLGDTLPEGQFDCVVSADVLEHVYAGDIPWVVNEMFSKARQFVFCNIACFPAAARLPSGEDAHIMVRAPAYWRGVFDCVANAYPDVDYVLICSMVWGLEQSVLFRRVPFEGLAGQGVYAVA